MTLTLCGIGSLGGRSKCHGVATLEVPFAKQDDGTCGGDIAEGFGEVKQLEDGGYSLPL